MKNIRNFCIIAHIDHGKSTLADRILELTETVATRDMEEQILDNMELERERGITIKARSVRLNYTDENGESYILNLIDTPGHVDFNYEVSRSLKACEGALLVVDAAQGIQAQTLANAYLAADNNLEIVPVINKIDLPNANIGAAIREIEEIIGVPAEDAPAVSAKTGLNMESVIKRIISGVPAPEGDENAPLKALIFDSYYDAYKGVIIYIRIMDGKLKTGDRIKMMHSGAEYELVEAGYLKPHGYTDAGVLSAGEVGYITASIKTLNEVSVGDTITLSENPASAPLPGFKKAMPMVYSGIYPSDGADYGALRDALLKLQLNDSALTFEPETSLALGFGFRCGFLGLLHMDIVQERIEREFDLNIIVTAPSVIYQINKKGGESVFIDNPTNYPSPDEISEALEPIVSASIITPAEFVGSIMELCQDRRGIFKDMRYIDANRTELRYELPLNEIIYDFFDSLKSRSKGYASLDYELAGYKISSLVKLDILLNGDIVDAFSFIVHAEKAYERGRRITEKLKDNIQRQLFEVPVQAAIGGKIIARETVRAMRKDVLAKCYGGDITRKKKLLEKQKEGKKKMRQLGSVEVSKEAFMAVLKLDE